MEDIADALGMTPDELIGHLGDEIWDEPVQWKHDWRFHVPEFLTKEWWCCMPYLNRALLFLMAQDAAAAYNIDDEHAEHGDYLGHLVPSQN